MTEQASRSRFGTLGLDVGVFGRWSRLAWGVLLLIPIAYAVVTSDLLDSGAFYLQAVLYLVGITAAYVLVYWAFGERFFASANPWVNTAIFVGPAFAVGWWPILVAPVTGVELPEALVLAMGVYIGVSFILQWRIGYGGCEVVSIPIILLRRRYVTYCIPLVALDAVEKKIVDSHAARKAVLASSSRHG
ncbi:MAG: hypothetical protein IH818_10900 [Acidobacteria bacterium]|nr:hypothetical protein [Acidobacteriota bacterium]MCZ6506406.1 hypothetical protein [Actinomycetota bacterium]